MLQNELDLPQPRKYKILYFGVTHVNWILVIINVTRVVEITRTVRYTWIMPSVSIRCGTAHTSSIRKIRSHVVKHDIHVNPGKNVRILRYDP